MITIDLTSSVLFLVVMLVADACWHGQVRGSRCAGRGQAGISGVAIQGIFAPGLGQWAKLDPTDSMLGCWLAIWV